MDELQMFLESLEERMQNLKDEILGLDENDSTYPYIEGCIETMQWVLEELADIEVPAAN
jgi:hypothetical protein